MMKLLIALFIFLSTFSAFAGGKSILPGLIRPGSIAIDGERIYIIDGPTCFIYALKDLKPQNKFGEDGEGPSQFKTKKGFFQLEMHLLPDSIFICSMGKISYFSKTGEYLRESLCPISANGSIVLPINDGFAGIISVVENKKPFHVLNIYNGHFNKTRELFKEENTLLSTSSINPLSARPIIRTSGSRVFVNGADGVIYCFDYNGSKLFEIKNIYEKKKVLDTHIHEIHEALKSDPRTRDFYEMMKSRLQFPGYFPPIRSYIVADEKLYVLPYATNPDTGVFFIYDFKGKLLKKASVRIVEINCLELFPYAVKNGKLYQIIEDQDSEEWELEISNL